MRAPLIAAFAVLGSSILLTAQGGQGRPPQEPTPTFRSSILAVPITVIVTDDKGNPVAGLTRDDFEILEAGVPQPITTFSAVDIAVERVERSGSEADVVGNDGPPGRLYLIALDLMGEELALRTRFFLRQFIERHFGPRDTAAVVLTTGSLSGSGQEFTSNRRLLLEAIDTFTGGSETGGHPWSRDKNFNSSFRDLTEILAKLPAPRKAMILVSTNIAGDADDAVDYRPSRFSWLSTNNIEPDFHRALSAATRGNIAIYPVNPGGLTTERPEAGSFDTSGMETRTRFTALAEMTGGFVVMNTNRYEASFERMVRENSTYYVLAFNAASERRSGSYVGVEVRVKRPGLRVRSPSGYVAPLDRPQPPRRPGTVLAAVWDAVVSPMTTSGVPMRVFAAPFRGAGKEAAVAIALELDGSKLGLVERDGAFRGELEVILAVTAQNKKKHAPMRHRAALALKPASYERVTKGAMRMLTHLALPKGQYQLRVSAGGAASAGSVVYDVQVPDFAEDLSISGLALTSTQAAETFTFAHPPVAVAFPAPPTTAREFADDDVLTLFAEVYENRRRPHTIEFTTELRNASREVVGTSTAKRQSVEKPTSVSTYSFSPRLSLSELPAGRYIARVEARSSLDPRASVFREIPFTVR